MTARPCWARRIARCRCGECRRWCRAPMQPISWRSPPPGTSHRPPWRDCRGRLLVGSTGTLCCADLDRGASNRSSPTEPLLHIRFVLFEVSDLTPEQRLDCLDVAEEPGALAPFAILYTAEQRHQLDHPIFVLLDHRGLGGTTSGPTRAQHVERVDEETRRIKALSL